MLKIGEKTFMNLQEAVGWLLENNSIPFQCTANYAANTEIGLGTIVNPTPAKVKIGSLIFFADSKVSTVIGITETGFICSDKYNNLVDDIAYVTGVEINASGHLITTLSDGQTIDAGLIKQVTSFSIDASQHLIATYNNGTTSDLGAIFQGNVNISGNLTADSIIENMAAGYSLQTNPSIDTATHTQTISFAGAVKNGNKLTLAYLMSYTRKDTVVGNSANVVFTLPYSIWNRLIYTPLGGINSAVAFGEIYCASGINSGVRLPFVAYKEYESGNYLFRVSLYKINENITLNTLYKCRFEVTFLLGTNLAA